MDTWPDGYVSSLAGGWHTQLIEGETYEGTWIWLREVSDRFGKVTKET